MYSRFFSQVLFSDSFLIKLVSCIEEIYFVSYKDSFSAILQSASTFTLSNGRRLAGIDQLSARTTENISICTGT